ncbi:MAG: hypothetical protein ACYDBW_00195 [Sulfuricaulis sp.]
MTLERSDTQAMPKFAFGEALDEQFDREEVYALLIDQDGGVGRQVFDLDRLIEQVQNVCCKVALFHDISSNSVSSAILVVNRQSHLNLTSLIGWS